MGTKFFLVLFISIVSLNALSIGSCTKFSPDGQSCQECITNYHLFEGECYVNILGCTQYQFGNICRQCDKNYILVNNMCCDMVCMSKIFSKFKKQVKQQVIQSNTQILGQLIPFIQKLYFKDTTGRLVAIQAKQYQDVRRYFLLYEFYQSQFYSKRIIVDYVLKSKKIIIVDWTEVSNSWKYANVDWNQIDEDASVLLLFPNFYPAEQKYTEIVARKAILSEVSQYEIATRNNELMELRVLYSQDNQQLILQDIIKKIQSTSTSQQNNPPSNSQPTQTSGSTSNASTISTSSTSSQPSSVSFSPYELKYQGMQINAELDANQPLIKSVDAVKNDTRWNHSLTLVVESGKIPAVIQFLIIGENSNSGSIVKYVVQFNKPTNQAFIVSLTEEYRQIQTTVVQQTKQLPSGTSSGIDSNSSSTTSGTGSSSSSQQQIVKITQNKVYVIEDGCTTHTYYPYPFSPEIQNLVNQLQQIKQQELTQGLSSTSGAPLISGGGLIARRLVVSQFCQNSIYRQIAYVEGDSTIKRQFFTYYFEVNNPNKTWYYLGQKNKTQNTSVWTNPVAFPIYDSDPSVMTYPSASLFFETNISSLYSQNLSSSDQTTYAMLTSTSSSQVDRNLGKMSRFAIDMANQTSMFRSTGWRVYDPPTGLIVGDMVSILCSQAMITQSLMIGSNGPIKQSGSKTTTISTTVTGDQSVKTTNVDNFISQDKILQEVIAWLKEQKPETNSYDLQQLELSEYTQSLQYNLKFEQANVNKDPVFVPRSQITAVIIHNKENHENVLMSFQIKQKTDPSATTTTSETSSNEANPEKQPTDSTENYVLVDLNKEIKDTASVPSESTGSQNPSSSTDNTEAIKNENQGAVTSQPSAQASTSSKVTDTIKEIEQKQRIQQILESISQQLVMKHSLNDPQIVQILQNIDPQLHIIKLNLIVEDQNEPTQNYTVVAVAHLDSQNDPIIQSVKVMTPETAIKLNQFIQTTSPQATTKQPTTLTCLNKTLNTNGQQVCQNQGSSGQNDITPGQPSQQNPINTNINSAQIPTSQPSKQALQLVEQKSLEQTIQSDGQVRKIYINPQTSSLSPDIQELLSLASKQEQSLEQKQQITEKPKQIKIFGIEVAATSVYSHYCVTIKIVYISSIVIRRYFYVNFSSGSQIEYMGQESLPSNFDISLSQNRAFKDMQTLDLNKNSQPTYENAVNLLNKQAKVIYTIYNVVYFKYRVFPIGNYQKITIKNQNNVANGHLIARNNNNYELINWNESPIIDLLPSNPSSPAQVSTETSGSAPSSNPTATSTQSITTPSKSTSTSSTQTLSQPNTNTNSNYQNSNTNMDNQNQNTPVDTQKTTTSTSTQISPSSGSQNTPTPQDLLNQQQQISPIDVVINLSLQQKLGDVLRFLSIQKSSQLTGGSLQQYAATQDKSTDGTLNAIQFDLYFIKFVSENLIKQFICSVVRHQPQGKMDIGLFLSNDIDLGTQQTSTPSEGQKITQNTQSNTANNDQTSSSGSQSTNVGNQASNPVTVTDHVIDQQVQLNSNFILVDPNNIYYSEAISLIEQDSNRQDFDQVIDLSNTQGVVQQVIRYLRSKYSIILDSGILRVVLSSKTSTVQKYRLYFFKEGVNGGQYEIYRAIIDYSTQTPEKKFMIGSFQIYVSNHQIVNSQLKVSDKSLQDDTDIAYGYVSLDLQLIASNQNIQNVLKYLNTKYKSIVTDKKLIKVEELKLLDGRINYKIIYKESENGSQFKLIVFYQPILQKVLVLNSVNLPQHSQYNQLSQDEQKADATFTKVMSYFNSIHPEISGFLVKSVRKATQTSFFQYQIIVQQNNKKFKSIIRISSNYVDLSQIDFSQIAQISLDHYRLDQFDQMFIMNYQKISQSQLRANSKVRMVMSFLHDTKKITDSAFLGAAYKPYGLGFLYKIFLTLGTQKQLTMAEVYIQAYSNKISLKSYKNIDFDSDLLSINIQEAAVTKIIGLIKKITKYNQFTVKSAAAKDFLYGTLYKLTLVTHSETVDIVIYHDHSTEQISPLYTKLNFDVDQCVYEGTQCIKCKLTNFRVLNNKCLQSISNCLSYNQTTCSQCGANTQLINGICIEKVNCNALCQNILF